MVLALALALSGVASPAAAQTALRSAVIAAGGGSAAGSGRVLHATVGQPAVGTSSGPARVALHGYWFAAAGPTTAVGDGGPPVSPAPFRLHPNPVRGDGVRFVLPRGAAVRLQLFDARGALVLDQPERWMPAGSHHVRLDRRRLAAGIYFWRLSADGVRHSGRLVRME